MSVDAVVGAAVKPARRGAAGHQSGGGVMRIGSLFNGRRLAVVRVMQPPADPKAIALRGGGT